MIFRITTDNAEKIVNEARAYARSENVTLDVAYSKIIERHREEFYNRCPDQRPPSRSLDPVSGHGGDVDFSQEPDDLEGRLCGCGKPTVSPHEATCGSDECLKRAYGDESWT